MPIQNLYQLSYTLHHPTTPKLLYINAFSPTEAIVSLIDEHDDQSLATLSSLSIALFNPSTGSFDAMDMEPECQSFIEFCRNIA